jgi:hypothetical protein
LLGSFRYDYYEGAFGEDEFKFDKDLIEKFIAKGWMTYHFNDHLLNGTYPAGEFALTEAARPIARSVPFPRSSIPSTKTR